MPEAARVGDIIGHSKSMWGMLIGTVLGAAIAIGGAVISVCLDGDWHWNKLCWYRLFCYWSFSSNWVWHS
ncbi:hypothetical protein [Providencia stuartii]|uniref:hypothetical protein n=1 Tax=Providencia stuartii TaxID=588 RepID=UPI00030E1BCD|nr:hypothetical protein [Providencia stuartii]